jgi:hypothetical protein
VNPFPLEAKRERPTVLEPMKAAVQGRRIPLVRYSRGSVYKGGGMRFVLIYEGPLPSNGSPEDKHKIRKQIHPQLKHQWEIDPTLKAWKAKDLPLGGMGGCEPDVPVPEVPLGGFNFVPLVVRNLCLVCSLDISFMRPDEPGSLIMPGGDIDNRLKTLFDSLTVPQENQLKGQKPGSGEDPFYCLLEDDSLITGLEVRTERLLKSAMGPRSPRGKDDVHLDIAVVVRPSQVTNNNMRFLGGFL